MYSNLGYNLLRTFVQAATSSFSYVIANQMFGNKRNYRQSNDNHYRQLRHKSISANTVNNKKILIEDSKGDSFLPQSFKSNQVIEYKKPSIEQTPKTLDVEQIRLLNNKSDITKRIFEKNFKIQGEN